MDAVEDMLDGFYYYPMNGMLLVPKGSVRDAEEGHKQVVMLMKKGVMPLASSVYVDEAVRFDG